MHHADPTDTDTDTDTDLAKVKVRLGFGTVPGPMAALIHLSEILVHGIDLALAIDRTDLVDQQMREELLAHMRPMDMDAFRRPRMFGPQKSAPECALAHERLLALLGRAV
ncbi:hypothetical protein [Streptomyces sp. NBC_01465]|uniref:hypothetical protein n=1 Tax=Streptomyces sp. NBC_01465 TaxID=2903878 RepID=UPI002E30C308|nr:hypothetical protein [Streptomyces sp. NBC_01465]